MKRGTNATTHLFAFPFPCPCLSCGQGPLTGCPMSSPTSSPTSPPFPMAWDSPWLQGQDTQPFGDCSISSHPVIPPSPSSCSTLPLFFYFNCNHSLSVSLLFFFFFFYFWDLSFQFNLLISVLISLCRLFADFTRHNFYQLVLKDA